MAEQDAGGNGGENLHVEVPVKGKFTARFGGSDGSNHDVLR
jgi:septal ring factor EnvC (AmiA/AmiB activator)